MIVITQDTPRLFQQELELCAARTDSWKCLTLKLSELHIRNERIFSEILDRVSLCLGDDGMRAFRFDNGDIHFLLKFATQKAFTALIEQLSKLTGSNLEKLAALYEVKVELQNLQELSQSYLPRNAPPPVSSLEKEVDLNKLAASLPHRRARRQDISILIVEDDPFSLRLVQKAIGSQHLLHTAEDGESGLNAYITHAPDILFLDIGLPDVNGLELMEKIFRLDPQAFIVILSGNGNRENVLKAVEKGAKGFVAKPFVKEKLFQYIDKNPFSKHILLRG